jgi:hypothetical protein
MAGETYTVVFKDAKRKQEMRLKVPKGKELTPQLVDQLARKAKFGPYSDPDYPGSRSDPDNPDRFSGIGRGIETKTTEALKPSRGGDGTSYYIDPTNNQERRAGEQTPKQQRQRRPPPAKVRDERTAFQKFLIDNPIGDFLSENVPESAAYVGGAIASLPRIAVEAAGSVKIPKAVGRFTPGPQGPPETPRLRKYREEAPARVRAAREAAGAIPGALFGPKTLGYDLAKTTSNLVAGAGMLPPETALVDPSAQETYAAVMGLPGVRAARREAGAAGVQNILRGIGRETVENPVGQALNVFGALELGAGALAPTLASAGERAALAASARTAGIGSRLQRLQTAGRASNLVAPERAALHARAERLMRGANIAESSRALSEAAQALGLIRSRAPYGITGATLDDWTGQAFPQSGLTGSPGYQAQRVFGGDLGTPQLKPGTFESGVPGDILFKEPTADELNASVLPRSEGPALFADFQRPKFNADGSQPALTPVEAATQEAAAAPPRNMFPGLAPAEALRPPFRVCPTETGVWWKRI